MWNYGTSRSEGHGEAATVIGEFRDSLRFAAVAVIKVLAVVDLNGDDFSIVIAPLRSRLLWKHGDGGGETIISSYV